MKKNNKSAAFVVSAGLVVLACLFLFAFNIGDASAQESDTIATTTAVALEEKAVSEEELPADVALDEKVTTEDLEATEAGVLPGSPLHFFKRAGWAFQEIFETDPVKDAELKIKHANQELAELKQLIDKEGFSNVNPNTINSVMERFEGRLGNVNNVAEALKERKESDPEKVDELLNNLTDKQFKYQKVLESIEKNVIKEKEENPDADDKIEEVFIKVSETKDKTLKNFGEVLGTVEENNPEKIAERIIKVADKQNGSEFKHLKNLEVLKRLEKQVPDGAKGAIALAQENTLKFFNRDIASLPEEARGERFKQYNRFSYGDETRQLSFLDDLKLLEDISPEILQKIEEVKEFAISKFEKKMSQFKQPGVLDNYMGHLSGEDFNDMVLAEQLASRALFENNPEIKKKMDDIRDRSVEEFTKRFTDPDSQAQVAKFQELERILEKKPGDPKVIKMMQELEAQIRKDPAKAEFLNQMDQLGDKMRFEFEAKFKNEGDKYFERIGTLDPSDFEVYKQFSGKNFLPDNLANKFLDHGVDQYRDYMRDIDNPENFDRFNTKFGNVPQFVIDEIRNRDSEFGDAMQFKRQAMEKLRFEDGRKMEIERKAVDYQERELTHQLDRARRQADEDFFKKVNSIPYENFDERKALFEEKLKTDLTRLEEENKAQLEIFNKRLEFDPWCDNSCKQIQKQFIDQEFRHQKDRIQDNYLSQQKQIEFDLGREKQNNPLFGLCDTLESCGSYCQNNPNIPACQGFFHEPTPFNDDFNGQKDYDCGPGKYFDFENNECGADPYYNAPTTFTQCKDGSRWNPNKGFCELDLIPKPVVDSDGFKRPNCGPDSYFDFRENRCISYNIAPKCPPGSYFGPFGKCVQENFQCPDIATAYPVPCPAGQNRDIITDNNGCKAFGECRGGDLPPPITCSAYFEGYEYNPSSSRCELRSSSGCSNPYKYKTITECQDGNITDSAHPHPASTSSWANHTWYFSDGGSSSSSILNRTDEEYLKYISQVEAACKTIPQSKFFWKAGAGNNSSSNWQNFGIPDCSGTAQPAQPAYQSTYPVAPTYPTTAYTSSDSECSSLQDILSGCHLMSENSNVRFNGAMDQYVQVGTRTIKYCSTNFIPGCASYYSSNSTYCPSPSYWDPAINGCAQGAATTAPISPPAPVCATLSNFGTCNYGYEYNSDGCAIGCRATSLSPLPTEPSPTPAFESPPPPTSEPTPPPVANVWKALKLLFSF